MRVGLVTSAFKPELGGIESHTLNLATALTRDGCEVDVITQCPAGKAAVWSQGSGDGNIPVLRFSDITHTRSFRIAPTLWSYLKTHADQYEVLHAHNYHAFPALAAATACAQPLVFTPHFHAIGHNAPARILHIPYRRIAQRIFDRSSAIFSVSAAEARLLRAVYPQYTSLIREVGTGIDSKSILNIDPYDSDVPIVLAGGRLEAYKRVDLVVDAFSSISDSAKLVITGTGPEETHLRAKVRKMGLSTQVRFLGHIDEEDLRRWQRTAVVTVSLSTKEAFGLGLAEAAVAGSRIVASDIPAHREVAELSDNTTGLVNVDASPQRIGDAVRGAIMGPKREPGQFRFQTWDDVARLVRSEYEEAVRNPH
jgi:glycosyltransferase involved in cell wall biosynthesis